jgi:transcriptional regulator with XRE-family HTH domain
VANISERIRDARKAAGLTQEVVARRADLSMNMVSRLELGKIQDPHYSTLSGIAHALGTTVAELVGEGEPVPLGEDPQESGPSLLEKGLDAARRDDAKGTRAINRLAASEGVLEATGVSGYAEDAFRADLRARNFPDEYFEDFLWPLVVMASRTTRRGEEANVLRESSEEYDETLVPRSPLTPEVFRGVLEALLEHEHQMEDLSMTMQDGYVEVGLKARENV